MTDAIDKFETNIAEAAICVENFDSSGHHFALRHVWVASISSFDLYMSELVSEAGLRWIDRTPPLLTPNLRQINIPLGRVLELDQLSPTERLLFYKDQVYSQVRFASFYRPDKISEALSYIWTCNPKEKWTRITNRMKSLERHTNRTEHDIRGELTLIGDRRDLITHSADISPGAIEANAIERDDAIRVISFIKDLAISIDEETEFQLSDITDML